MRKISIQTLSLSAFLLTAGALPQAANAQDARQGAYINLGAAVLNADFNLDEVDVSSTAITLEDETANIVVLNGRLGYRLNKYFAAEVEGGFGLSGDSNNQNVPIDTGLIGTIDVDLNANLDVSSYGAGFVRAILPVSDQFDIFLRGGYGVASAEAELDATTPLLGGATISDSVSDTIDGFAYGVGGEYHITDKHGLRFDFSAINSDEVDVLFFAAAYSYKF